MCVCEYTLPPQQTEIRMSSPPPWSAVLAFFLRGKPENEATCVCVCEDILPPQQTVNSPPPPWSAGGSLDHYGGIPELLLGRIVVAVSGAWTAAMILRLFHKRGIKLLIVAFCAGCEGVNYLLFLPVQVVKGLNYLLLLSVQVVKGLNYLWSMKIMHRGILTHLTSQ